MAQKTVCCIFTILLIFSISLYSQEKFSYDLLKKVQPQDAPHYDLALVNMASEFREQSRLMFFVKIVNDELQYIKSKSKQFQADFEISIVISDTGGVEVVSKKEVGRVIAQKFDDVNSRDLYYISRLSFDLEPKLYAFKVELKDMETTRASYQEGTVKIVDFSMTDVTISEVLFLDSLSVEDKLNSDVSNFDSNLNHADTTSFAYFEVYNVPDNDSIKIDFDIFNPANDSLFHSEFWTTSQGRITPLCIQINRLKQLVGIDRIKITMSSGDTTLMFVKKPISFFRVNPYYDFSNVQDAIEKLVYIAKDDEMKKLKKAKGKAQSEEFKKFWKKRDPTPDTPYNEYLEEYYRRIELANKTFKGSQEGWRTEMGMVFIKLGAPSYIDKPLGYNEYYDETSFRRPPIIWYYNSLNRRVIFVYRIGEYRIDNQSEIFDILNDEMRY